MTSGSSALDSGQGRKRPYRPHGPKGQRPDGPSWRQQMYDIIFEADSFWGRAFDVALLVAILLSITTIALETVPSIKANSFALRWLLHFEHLLTLLFGIEYLCRLVSTRHPLKYAFSFWGIIDLLSFLPSMITGFGLLSDTSRESAFVILRSIRLLRVFRILKLWRMMSSADELAQAIWKARDKIVVFLAVVLIAVTISGTLMYHIEYQEVDGVPTSQFTSIPQSMYWAIVTMTTVGYGDIVPKTTPGKVISAALILLGYSLIIVPTGFVSAEISGLVIQQNSDLSRVCPECEKAGHPRDAYFCNRCGTRLPDLESTL